MIRRLIDWLAPERPAEPSALDRMDARKPGANCCGGEVVAKVADWTLCADHNLTA